MSSQLNPHDEVVFLVYVPVSPGLNYSVIWVETVEGEERLYEQFPGIHGKLDTASVPYSMSDAETIVPHVIPNHSYVPWLSCAECGACSWMDYLCPECRNG